MSANDLPAEPWCVYCRFGWHELCLYRTRPLSCECPCPWLVNQGGKDG